MKDSLDLIVLGNPRSGTTLLRLALSAHPEICIPPECGFAIWLESKFGCAPFPESAESFAMAVIKSKKFETWGLTVNDVIDALRMAHAESYQEAVVTVYKIYAEKSGNAPNLLGDKNNYYVYHIDQLYEVFPSAKVVWIVRDPRDTFCSYKALKNRDSSQSSYYPGLSCTTKEFNASWLEVNECRQQCLKRFEKNGFMLVRYEDLVGSPAATLEKLCRFLGVKFNERMLRFYEFSDEPIEFLEWKQKTTKPFDGKSVGRYLGELDFTEISAIEIAAGDVMQALGYDLS